jgi:hypothetical protein
VTFEYPPAPTCSTLWLACRESIDAGAARIAVDHARFWARSEPHPRAVVAAIEGAATGDEDSWHDALVIALDQGLRLIAVDALEGLAVAAATTESWAESLRLVGAAERLGDETGYRWRFGFEQRAVDTARAAAAEALGDAAEAAATEGRGLDWREAAAYARRARGERKRPHHGWARDHPRSRDSGCHRDCVNTAGDRARARMILVGSDTDVHASTSWRASGSRVATASSRTTTEAAESKAPAVDGERGWPFSIGAGGSSLC